MQEQFRRAVGNIGKDGRTLRSERSHRSIAEALLACYAEGRLRPTAREVADRAGVSLRTVFGHFEKLEELHTEAALLHIGRVSATLGARPIVPRGTRRQRAELLVRKLSRIWEEHAGIERATRLAQHESRVLASFLSRGVRARRALLEATFARELAGRSAAERALCLDLALLLTSFEAWDQLRLVHRRTASEAQASVERGLELAFSSRASTS
jgi:AcrR family transcriptional regulator